MPDGILIIDKPSDWTSMDVCAKLRGIFHEKRIGHGGTLDPMATGVLPVFIGRATRAVEFSEKGDKEYVASLRLGRVTDTQDSTGTVLEEHSVPAASAAAVASLLPRFTGEIEQIPPMYSAIKINGQKLYQLARRGREVERPSRRITIRELELLEPASNGDLRLRIRCSKGTYVRTLCHDIGQALGCGAIMTGLRRTMACGFTLEQAVTLERLFSCAAPGALLLPTEALFSDYPKTVLPPEAEKKVRNGAAASCRGLPPGDYRTYSQDGIFLALCRSDGAALTTIKSFFQVEMQQSR